MICIASHHSAKLPMGNDWSDVNDETAKQLPQARLAPWRWAPLAREPYDSSPRPSRTVLGRAGNTAELAQTSREKKGNRWGGKGGDRSLAKPPGSGGDALRVDSPGSGESVPAAHHWNRKAGRVGFLFPFARKAQG